MIYFSDFGEFQSLLLRFQAMKSFSFAAISQNFEMHETLHINSVFLRKLQHFWQFRYNILSGLFVLVGDAVYAIGRIRASGHLHRGLLLSMLRAPMLFFDSTPLGRIVNRFSRDLDTVDTAIPQMFKWFIFCLYDVIGIVLVLSISMPLFLTSLLPLFILYFFTQVHVVVVCCFFSLHENARMQNVFRSTCWCVKLSFDVMPYILSVIVNNW